MFDNFSGSAYSFIFKRTRTLGPGASAFQNGRSIFVLPWRIGRARDSDKP